MNGYFYESLQIKEGAKPIDNITKFAWDDEDYEEVEVWHEYSLEELKQNLSAEIRQIKQKLLDTDYIVIKIAEGLATWDDYPEIKAQRQAWRDEINKLKDEEKNLSE